MRIAFDRGTLLLTDPVPGSDPASLPGTVWDPRVRAWRAPAMSHAAIGRALSDAGVRFSDGVRIPDGLAADPALDRPPVPLRPYQDDALAAWELSGRRGVVVLPTGAGKTRLALAAIARTGLAAACLVPTRALMVQWAAAVREDLGVEPALLGDGRREVGPVTVATFEAAWRSMDRLGTRFGLLVVDEAHHFGGGARDEALEMSVAPARLGLTATPPAAEGGARALDRLVGPVVFERAPRDLAGSWLAAFDHLTVHLDLDPAERRAYAARTAPYRDALGAWRRSHPGGSGTEFARHLARTADGRRILAACAEARRMLALTRAKRAVLAALLARHRDARVLVFTADNTTAYEVARRHLVMPVTCDIGRGEREGVLAAFREGRLRALVSSRVLDEGLDVPDAEVGIVLGGNASPGRHVQRVGRLLRPAGEEKRARIFELVTRDTMEAAWSRRRRRGLDGRSDPPR